MNAGPAAKRDRQRAIREIIVRDPIGNQQELAERLVERGFAVTQATVSRDIAELGHRQGPPRRPPPLRLDRGRRRSARGRTSDERLRRILADIPVTVGRSGLILLVTGSPGTASVIAQAIDESTDRAGRHARGRQHAARPVRRRGPPRALARAVRGTQVGAGAPGRAGGLAMKKVVLAYSGGLDTSVAVAWLREQFDAEVVTLTVDVGGGSLREGVEARAMSAGASRAYVVDARDRFVRDFVWPHLQANAVYQGAYPLATALARPLIAQLLVEVAAPRGRRRGRPRLHRQGQRPGPVRRRGPRPRPGARGRRPDAGRDGPDPRRGDRLRDRARDRDPDHEGLAVLDRRQPLGPVVRDRHPRGPVDHAAGRRLRVDGRGVRRARRRSRSRSSSRAGSRSRSTASGSPRSSSSTGSTTWAAPTASGGSTTSRTASSGSRAARSTRRRRRRSSTRRTARSRG